MKSYITTPIEKTLEEYKQNSDQELQHKSQEFRASLFHEMAEHVPAYKDFLAKHSIDHLKIRSKDDFEQVPVIDKPSYIDQYPLHMLCWNGTLDSSSMLSASSGSTGKPYFWPRSSYQTEEGAFISSLLYDEFFHMRKKRTLYIVAFAMGTWIAGTYMMMSTLEVAKHGFPVTVVTPGLNKDEILRLCRLGHDEYEQTVLVGYPPFVKDVIDYGILGGIAWKDMNIKFLFSGEAITEGWRSHIQSKVNLPNILTDAINIYGSADVGLIAHETAMSIFLRRTVAEDKTLSESIFHTSRVPAIYQYDPSLRYFERIGEELVISARSGIPLLRYNTKDVGDVLWYEQIINVPGIQKNIVHIPESLRWRLPFVYLYGRGKFSATLYGITIYPEYMKHLLDHPFLEKLYTGKFILKTEETVSHDQTLEIHLELKDAHESSSKIETETLEIILKELPLISSEFRHLLSQMGQKVHPRIVLHQYGDPDYFPRGVIKKTS